MASTVPPSPGVSERHTIWLGSRKSALALVQTNHIKALLEKHFPQLKFAIKEQQTLGDKILNVPLAAIGDKGMDFLAKH
jgi:hydroxymethylbilane synthase